MVYHSELTVLRCSSGTVATWAVLPKKQSTICFEVIFLQTIFDRFGSGSRWTVDLFRGHTYRSMIRHLWRSYKRLLRHRQRIFPTFLYSNRHEPFFKCLSNCAGYNKNKSFLQPGNIEYMLVEEMPKDASISRYVTWRSCIISSRTASMFSDTTADFGRPPRT